MINLKLFTSNQKRMREDSVALSATRSLLSRSAGSYPLHRISRFWEDLRINRLSPCYLRRNRTPRAYSTSDTISGLVMCAFVPRDFKRESARRSCETQPANGILADFLARGSYSLGNLDKWNVYVEVTRRDAWSVCSAFRYNEYLFEVSRELYYKEYNFLSLPFNCRQ